MRRGAPRDETPAHGASPDFPAVGRFDVVLHHLCLIATRAQAARAIDEGQAMLNGVRVRPAQHVRAGDTLALTFGRRTRTFVLTALPARGQSRKDAPQFYRLLSDEDTAR